MVALIFAEIVSSSLRDRRAALANSFKHQAHFAGDRTADGRKKKIQQARKGGSNSDSGTAQAVQISYNGNSPDLTFSMRA
jgi:hypothetical protein